MLEYSCQAQYCKKYQISTCLQFLVKCSGSNIKIKDFSKHKMQELWKRYVGQFACWNVPGKVGSLWEAGRTFIQRHRYTPPIFMTTTTRYMKDKTVIVLQIVIWSFQGTQNKLTNLFKICTSLGEFISPTFTNMDFPSYKVLDSPGHALWHNSPPTNGSFCFPSGLGQNSPLSKLSL